MPLYDWKCTNKKCGKEFEQSVSLTEFDTAKVYCPDCICLECDGTGSWFDGSHGANKRCGSCKATGKNLAKRMLSSIRTGHTTWKNWRLGD